MTPRRWAQVERVCQAALDCPPGDRAALLARECSNDADLGREVESLLREQAHAEEVLGTPPWTAAAEVESGDGRTPPRFAPGQRLGPFEIVSLVGTGGMGEVYRARDTRLGRTVAVKVLPPETAADPDSRSRLEVEARAASALAHPHICALFDIRSDEGVDYLVMEHLEGETLAERLARCRPAGPCLSSPALRLDEALEFGAQIAAALAAAHRQGIVHRDLKPGNVMLTRDGVKLLDFGLAKLKPPATGMAMPTAGGPAPHTAAGVVLGTVNYMAPEQLQGKDADARSDLFAFGALLFEMLTGRRAFEGSTPASVIAAILERDPSLPADWPLLAPSLDRLVRGCLAKDPDHRWDSAWLAAQELRRIATDWGRREAVRADLALPARPRGVAARRWIALSLGLAVLAALLWGGGLAWRASRPAPPAGRLERLDLDLGMRFVVHPRTARAVLSPDGTRVVFRGVGPDGMLTLFTRRLDRAEATPLGTTAGTDIFFSPDGQWLGLVAGGKLRKVNIEGGSVLDLCDAASDPFRGAGWGDAGFIVASFGPATGLSRLPASGGAPVPLTTLDASRDDVTHRWPQVLSGSEVVIFTSHTFAGRYDDATIEALTVSTGRRTILHRGGYFGRYLPSGHLVFVRHNTLFAAPMNLARLELTGPPVPVLDAVVGDEDMGKLEFSFSNAGDLLTLTGRWRPSTSVLAWGTRDAPDTVLPLPEDSYADPRVSPDGRRVALSVPHGLTRQLVVYEEGRRTPFRLVSETMDISPIWAPDGDHLVFGSDRDLGVPNLFWRRADGAGSVHQLTSSPNVQAAYSFADGGRRLAFVEQGPVTGPDVWVLPLDLRDPDRPVPGAPEPLVRTPASEGGPAFSPDGQWLAYDSDESGRPEVYVLALAPAGAAGAAGDRWQVSREGGTNPLWSRDSRRILFQDQSEHLMVAEVETRAGALVAREPHLWAPWLLVPRDARLAIRTFDLSPDGQRVLLLRPVARLAREEPRAAVTLFRNFFDELRRRAPKGR